MSDSNRVTQAEWEQWDRERLERAQADLERTAWHNRQPKGTDHITDQIMELEERLYLRGVLLESALELLDARAVELASLRSLIRAEAAIRAIDRDLAVAA